MARSKLAPFRYVSLMIFVGCGVVIADVPTPNPADAIPPVLIAEHQKAPVYPPAAKEARMSGVVVVETEIDATGKVQNVKIIECSHKQLGFEEASEAAVRQWRFHPAIFGGQPVPYSTRFRLSFGMNEGAPGVKTTRVLQGTPVRDPLRRAEPTERPSDPSRSAKSQL